MRLSRLGVRAAALAVLVALLGACDTDATSLYDPDATGNDAPSIASVSPTGVVLAGVDEITIEGQNFSATPSENVVYFDDGQGNSTRAEVLEASATRLLIKAPNFPNPGLAIRVAVLGARDFSNSVPAPLTAATGAFGELARTERPFSIASDAAGDLFLSLFNEGRSVGVVRIAPDEARTLYASTRSSYSGLRVGADGTVYGARRVQAAVRIPEGGREVILNPILAASVKITAVDLDAEGRIWGVGDNTAIYRIDPDETSTSFPFVANLRDVLIWENALYAAGTQGDDDEQSRVWRFPIGSDGSLGAPVVVYDAQAEIGANALALAVSADGTLFIGTDADDPVVVIPAGGSPEALYPGVLTGPAASFAWGPNSTLYVVQGDDPDTPLTTESGLYFVETRRPRGR